MNDLIPATVIILTKDEEDTVSRAVHSCKSFVDVVVVDSGSADHTVERALQAGARVLQFAWDGSYPKKKEWSAAHPTVRTDWVVLLDADEELTGDLLAELRTYICTSSVAGVDVPLEYVWQGRTLRHGHRVTKRIAYRRNLTTWPRPDDLDVKTMWEVEGHYQPSVKGRVIAAKTSMRHEDTGSLFQYFLRQNRYTDWEAWVLESSDRAAIDTRSRRGRRAAVLPFKPLVFFVYAYIYRQGFRDGRQGFDYAFAQTTYYWQIGLKRRELRRVGLAETSKGPRAAK